MTAVPPYDPAEPLPGGRVVIEASAGTGKTFTIAAATTRLVAEGTDLERILVVTFTRAATAELRARIRKRMVDTVHALEGLGEADDHMEVLLAADPTRRETYRSRLQAALTRYDRAQIFTIHGFASRLLGQLGFRALVPDDLEPETVDDLLLTQTAGDLVVARFADNAAGDEVVAPRDLVTLGRAVIETPDAHIVPAADAVSGTARTRVEMTHAMREELTRRMRHRGSVTWDDGLVGVRDALDDPLVGAAARELLERRYEIALVDESQDTDPVQWDVIHHVFDRSRLVVIGDPKQSIYSFRGADIESYLAAVEGADVRRTLATNWRSDPPLIRALDVLFAGATFGDERIEYQPVHPPTRLSTTRMSGRGAALTIRRFGDGVPIRRRKDGYYYIGACREVVAADTAAEIVRMLEADHRLPDGDDTRALEPGDIAVLCRTRKQVDLVRTALDRRDVPSVAARSGGVFATPAAEEWRRFLIAVELPDRIDLVRMAATTVLIGRTPHEVAALDDDGVLRLQLQMREWHEIFTTSGLPALVERLNRTTDLAARVLAGSDGERVMTDLAHIAEEMHTVWRRGRIGSLVAWLDATMAEANERARSGAEEPESRQRRLETDAAAVEVQTVHGAKGLEYPVVFVPFAWDVPWWMPEIPVFHDPEGAEQGRPRRRLIDVGGEQGPDFGSHQQLAKDEEIAEEGRLLYVALTRAKHRLVVWWIDGAQPTSDSKLDELITRGDRSPDELVSTGDGTIAVQTLEEAPPVHRFTASPGAGMALDLACFDRALDHQWRRASFTSLSPEHVIAYVEEAQEEALEFDEIEVVEDEDALSVHAAGLPMADLPRGARFGTLVHHVLEHVRFDAPDLEGAIRAVLEPEMERGAWDLDADSLVAGLVATIETPLGPAPDAIRLRDVTPDRVLDEMRFELPVPAGGRTVAIDHVASLMADHLPVDDPYRDWAVRISSDGASGFRGYLTGAIDVTLALSAGNVTRYVVMDYKSNTMHALGKVAAASDYGPIPLAQAMVGGDYVLQATLYQVALHRYLQWRLPGYDPETHLGGSLYLFVRGMTGPETPVVEGERCGVARWRPPTTMITAISDLFRDGPP